MTAVAGTPAAEGSNSSAGASPTPLVGEPVDAATVDAVAETVRQFLACAGEGNLPAAASTMTDEGASVYLAFPALGFVQARTGGATPTGDIDPALLDAFLAAITVPVPVPAEGRVSLIEVREVIRLADGRLAATLLVAQGGEEPSQDRIPLGEVDGGVRLAIFEQRPGDAEATPAGATPEVATPTG